MGEFPFPDAFRRAPRPGQTGAFSVKIGPVLYSGGLQVEPAPDVQDGAKRMVSKQLYRDGMARFAGAVHIVTTDGPAGRAGFTASAACSVTDDPPTLLVCLNRASQLHSTFLENGVFCLNTLAGDQRELSELFARHGGVPMQKRFAPRRWEKFNTGAPVLRDALACFDCRVTDVKEVGTHWVLFGAVQDIRMSSGPSALLYLHRAYRTLSFSGGLQVKPAPDQNREKD
jgi:cob(II)yrinic acid a,c-diamide reductase